MVPLLKPTAATLAPIDDYRPFAEFVLALDQLPLGRVVNDARVDDHHAIIPTDVDHDVSVFSPDERRVFDLIARRFLAVFHPPARYARTTVITEVEGERFRTRGKITLEAGWRGVYGLEADEERKADDETEAESGELPPLEQGQSVRCVSAEAEAKETKPPPRYTEATLLSAMETAGKLVEDEEAREAMKERGLGTPATRAETIETLIRREYIERVSKELQPTPKGLQVITMLEQHPLTSPELTGDWEKRLADIERGKGDRGRFIQDIAGFTASTVEQIAALDKEKLRPERVELGPCPRCGAVTGEIIRENSRAYGCTSWKSREEPGCGFVIWKRVAGRTLTPEIARQLLEEGRTKEVLSGFRSRAGKPFRARLVLNEDGKVEFEFPQARQTKEAAVAE
jgi:DNA topoisomerase-3